jgi:hypothetical protein
MIDEMDAKQPLLENTSFFKMYRDAKFFNQIIDLDFRAKVENTPHNKPLRLFDF